MLSYRVGYWINFVIALLALSIAFMEHHSVESILHPYESSFYKVGDGLNGTYSRCANNTFMDTVYCEDIFVESFYKYNLTYDTVPESFVDLRRGGGDCLDWAGFYVSEFRHYGFNASILVLDYNDSVSHAVAYVWDVNSSQYCIVDQEDILGCQRLG